MKVQKIYQRIPSIFNLNETTRSYELTILWSRRISTKNRLQIDVEHSCTVFPPFLARERICRIDIVFPIATFPRSIIYCIHILYKTTLPLTTFFRGWKMASPLVDHSKSSHERGVPRWQWEMLRNWAGTIHANIFYRWPLRLIDAPSFKTCQKMG